VRPLLCRRPLYPDESLVSYLSRLAAANCYEPVTLLTNFIRRHLAGMDVRDNLQAPKRPETFEVLGTLTQTNPDDLATASIHRLAQAPVFTERQNQVIYLTSGQLFPLLEGRTKTRKLRRDERAQFCPVCLGQAAYHHLAWIPLEIKVCLKHRCFLVEGCRHCQAGVSIHDIVRRHCAQCEADLADIVPDYLNPDALDLFAQRTIQAWWGVTDPSQTRSKWTLPPEPVATLYRLFEQLTEAIDLTWRWEHFYHLTANPPNPHLAQTLAFKALVNWPQGFWGFLQEFLPRERALHDHNPFLHSAQESSLVARLWGLGQLPRYRFVQAALHPFLVKNNFKICFPRGVTRIYWPDL
jgi:hypothetical protein